MKAFHVREYEIWAAESPEEVKEAYFKEHGEPVHDDDFCELTDEELDRPFPEMNEDEVPTGRMTTLRRYLNEQDKPGVLVTFCN
jgi:hypothetical protein